MSELKHYPVMLKECIEGLNLKTDGIYFDGTLGGAGHSYEILKNSSPDGRLIATDLDGQAIERAKIRLSEFDGRYTLVNDNYKNFKNIINGLGVDNVDGILLDFGVSSFQLDDSSRGFSYIARESELDMRMDQSQSFSAKDVVNEYSESELARIIFEYGEDKFARRIAENITKYRNKKRIETCGELDDIIEASIPKKFQTDGHPSKRTFQAIRIEVNGELEGLKNAVFEMTRSLKKGGRIVILTFHSLEDRIVKQAFNEMASDCICDKSLPVCVCGHKREINVLTKHPITASEKELSENSRSKSAKLRIAEKL